jgi:hypothetical protein
MGAKLFAAVLGLVLVQASAFEESAYAAGYLSDRYVIRLFGPRSHYESVVVRGLFDSCWRYRQSREPERFWTCRNYIKPNAEFDWGYGTSIADQANRYGYR